MKYKQYYHGSYERLPLEVQEGLKQQYGTNDWPTVSRMWDQERGVTYAPRPIQPPANNPSFNRSTYEKGTYTLPSPVSRAFTRLGQGIGNAYNSASQGLAEWGKRNPGWERAVRNMVYAIGEAQDKGQYGITEGSKAFTDTLDPNSDYNLERRQKLRELNPAQAEYEDAIQTLMSTYGLSKQEAEAKYRTMSEEDRQHLIDKRKADLDYTRSRTGLNNAKASLTDARALTEESKRDVNSAKASYYNAKSDTEKNEAARLVIITRKEEELLQKAKNDNLSEPAKELQRIKETVTLEGRWEGDPQAYKAEVQRRFRIYAQQQADLSETAVKKAKAELDSQKLDNENQRIQNLIAGIDFQNAKLEFKQAVFGWQYKDFNSLPQDMQTLYLSAKNAPGGTDADGWKAVEDQIKRDIEDQKAGTENTKASTEKIRKAFDSGDPANLPDDDRKAWDAVYATTAGDDATKRDAAWKYVMGNVELERAETKTKITLTTEQANKIINDIKNGIVGGTSKDYNDYRAEVIAGNFEGSYYNWTAKNARAGDSKVFSQLASGYENILSKQRAAGEITINGVKRTGDAATNTTDEEIITEATFRASEHILNDKKDLAAHRTDQDARRKQFDDAVETRDAANEMVKKAVEALRHLENTDDAQYGTFQIIYNTFLRGMTSLGWASKEQKQKADSIDAFDQLTTGFALTAVQLTKGAISNREMDSFERMYASVDRTKGANELRMKMVYYVGTITAAFYDRIATENRNTRDYVGMERWSQIRDEVRDEFKGQRDDFYPELSKYIDAPGSYDVVTIFTNALSELVKDKDATAEDVEALKSQFVSAGGTEDQMRTIFENNEKLAKAVVAISSKSKPNIVEQ